MSLFEAIRQMKFGLKPPPPQDPDKNVPPAVSFMCNECYYQFKPREERYQCSECQGLDLCSKCYKKERKLTKKALAGDNDADSLLKLKHPDNAPFPHLFTVETKSQLGMAYGNKGKTVYESLQNSFADHKNRRCIGSREKVAVSERYPFGLGQFVWLTYQQFHDKTELFGRALNQFIPTRSFVAICGNNRLEWYVADIGCLWYGNPVVPIHHQTSSESIQEILNNSESQCIVIENSIVEQLVDLLVQDKCKIKLLVVMEDEGQPLNPSLKRLPKSLKVHTFDEMLNIGKKVKNAKHNPIQPDEIFSLFYTSGSTGVPKGVISKDKEFNQQVVESFVEYPSAALSFLTLAHSQRRFDYKLLYHGSKIGIFSGSMDSLFDDIQTLRPTIFWGVPRIWNLIFSQYQIELNNFKKENPSSSIEYCEEKVLKKFKGVLGDRVKSIVTGGAPTSDEVIRFMKGCWPHIGMSNSYGLTEAIGIFVDGYIQEDIEYRLDPVPEFGYYPTDTPNPRGELLVKSKTMTTGYYRNEKLTNDAFTDGWFKTGDIVEQIGWRKIKIIDRKKHAFKLSNGEFVAPEPLENIYLASKLIEQIFIYGDTLKTFLVAIVIPRQSIVADYGLDNENRSRDEILNDPKLKNILYREIQDISLTKKLANYQIPRIITVDDTKWTIENELITGSGKFCRGKLTTHYKSKIDEMYQTIDNLQNHLNNVDINNNNESISSTTTTPLLNSTLIEYLKSTLNIDVGEQDTIQSLSFTQLGGDSLGAIRLSNLLKEKSNITITPTFILNNNNNLSNISNFLNGTDDGGKSAIQSGSSVVDWNQEFKSLDKDITTVGKPIASVLEKNNTVLLTGATGYLGAHLLHQLIKSTDKVEKIYCLVRGTQAESRDHKRLFSLLNDKYKLKVDQLEMERVVVVRGDLSLPLFGMDREEFDKLGDTVDFIIHNGAVVNMVIPYENMRDTNVGGTKEAIRLACAGDTVKPVMFISTMGVYAVRDQTIDETVIPTTQLIAQMGGYNQSKLVAEHIVSDAHSRGFPITMVRPATIYSDTRTGIDNDHDFVRMIIRGLLKLESYPNDLTPLNTGHGGGKFNLSPVDWVSESIVQLALHQSSWMSSSHPNPASPFPIYHMINEEGVEVSRIAQVINDTLFPMKGVSIGEWRSMVSEISDPSHPLYPIKDAFKHGFPGFGSRGFRNPITSRQLKSINLSKCPAISNQSIQLNVKYLNEN